MKHPPYRDRLRYHFSALLVMIGLALLLGLGAWLSIRFDRSFDLTSSARHALSPASHAVLEKFSGPVTIVAYASNNTLVRERLRRLLEPYQRAKPDLSYSFTDLDLFPVRARHAGVRVDGELVVSYESREQHVAEATERALSSALLRLLRDQQAYVAFLSGHGERAPFGEANYDLGLWVQHLERQGLKVLPLNLSDTGQIPANTSVLVVASPQAQLLPAELRAIQTFLQAGGNLLWLADPGSLHGMESIAHALNTILDDGTVMDPSAARLGIQQPQMAIISRYPAHDALDGFRFVTVFPAARPVSDRAAAKDGWERTAILMTSNEAWLQTASGQDSTAATESRQSYNLGLTLKREADNGEQRIVIIGDGDFLANTYLGNSGNLDLGLRLMNWLVGADTLVDIPARDAVDAQLELGKVHTFFIGFGFLVALPMLFLFSAAYLWYRSSRA
jgi:hypothetical protein